MNLGHPTELDWYRDVEKNPFTSKNLVERYFALNAKINTLEVERLLIEWFLRKNCFSKGL